MTHEEPGSLGTLKNSNTSTITLLFFQGSTHARSRHDFCELITSDSIVSMRLYVSPDPHGSSYSTMLEYVLANGHLEVPDRLRGAMSALSSPLDLAPLIVFLPDRLATDEEIMIAHSSEYTLALRRMELTGTADTHHFPNITAIVRPSLRLFEKSAAKKDRFL